VQWAGNPVSEEEPSGQVGFLVRTGSVPGMKGPLKVHN